MINITKGESMPAVSKSQRQAAGIAIALKRGDIPASKAGEAARSMAKMPTSSLRDYAQTKHGNLPEHVSKK